MWETWWLWDTKGATQGVRLNNSSLWHARDWDSLLCPLLMSWIWLNTRHVGCKHLAVEWGCYCIIYFYSGLWVCRELLVLNLPVVFCLAVKFSERSNSVPLTFFWISPSFNLTHLNFLGSILRPTSKTIAARFWYVTLLSQIQDLLGSDINIYRKPDTKCSVTCCPLP